MNPNERKIITGIDPETGHVGPRYEMDPDSPAYQPIQPRSLTPELLAAKFVGSLGAKLAEYEDAETAIAVYRQANVTINELKRIKELCLDLAQSELRANGETHRATVLGSAGWSQPKTPRLDKGAWEHAAALEPDLAKIQADFDRAKKLLEVAQEPFMVLPEPAFFIR